MSATWSGEEPPKGRPRAVPPALSHFFPHLSTKPTSIPGMRETAWILRRTALGAWVVLGWGVAGCQPAEVKECRDRYLVTHAQVAAVDPQDLVSVESALSAVDGNLEVCQRANLAEESKQLGIAKRKLESHQSYLSSRGSQRELTSEQLDGLEKNGDPECPKGQAYQYKKSGKKIRCTGPQILSMNETEAKAYFGGRGFKLNSTDKGLKAELGSESYTFEYASNGRGNAAECVVIFSQPGIAWQETVARVTGAMPSRLKLGTPVRLGKLDVPYALETDPVQAILRFGTCAASAAPNATATVSPQGETK